MIKIMEYWEKKYWKLKEKNETDEKTRVGCTLFVLIITLIITIVIISNV